MLCEVPLTKEQQDFAAEHHGLVYKFLNDNHLPENEFYDVVIFPYLKAVQDYCNSASAQKYSFSTIAIRQMKFRLYDYFRTQARRKRNTEVISIHLAYTRMAFRWKRCCRVRTVSCRNLKCSRCSMIWLPMFLNNR